MKEIHMKKSLKLLFSAFLLFSSFCFSFSPNLKEQETQKYLVGPRDVLSIEVWRHPDTSKDVIVNYLGEITLPPIKNMPVAGLTPPQIEKKMAEALAFFLSTPSCM